MSDIVERLRKHAFSTLDLMAADEIERLEDALKEIAGILRQGKRERASQAFNLAIRALKEQPANMSGTDLQSMDEVRERDRALKKQK